MAMQTTIYSNGHGAYNVERNSLLAASQIAELQQRLVTVQSENTELNRRLSLQNRPGKQLGGCIEVASVILSEHLMGGTVGIVALQTKYPQIGRRRREWGLALLRMAGIVTGSNQYGVKFAEMTVNRAWQKLTQTAEMLAQSTDGIEQLRRYLPKYRH